MHQDHDSTVAPPCRVAALVDAGEPVDLRTDPLRRTRLSAEELAAYQHQGFVMVPGALAPAQVAALSQDVRAVLQARNAADSYLAQASEYLAGSPIAALVMSERLRGLAEQALAGPGRLYLPFTAVKGPGQGPFTFHQDNSYTQLDGPACNCWVALSAMRPDTGCLRMVPGSHRTGTLPADASLACPGHRQVAQPQSWTELVMAPGDLVIFSRLTVHGSGANSTHAPRLAYAVQFHHVDARALFDGRWELLTVRPRWQVGPVERLSAEAGREV